ncbi:NB-ARC domain disease resistance protein, putative [Medicago truncatula]|uniref:NB-ARC domain disease resistance protein, putative n=1 Tax=Medicago truncatula TaxID=3880 RepID=G7L7I1_MEDTR|nr:NB-ARC domain disease resistance protein, putative [Medicago truncatula]
MVNIEIYIVGIVFWTATAALSVLAFISLRLDYLLSEGEDKVEWIERKLKLLKALLEDHSQLVKKREEAESRVRSFWDIENLSEIHHQLSIAESEWIESTRDVVSKAEGCVAEYKKQSPGLFWSAITVIFRLMTIKDVLRQIDDVENELTLSFEKRNENAKYIHMSMEKSRSKSRSLLDQFTFEEEDRSVAREVHTSVAAQNQMQKKPSISFDQLMNKSVAMDLFSGMEERWSIYLLLPLHAFLKDLRQLQLITETEKQWKTVAGEIIEDAEIYISNYLWWFETFGILKKSKMNIPLITNHFRKDMKLIVTGFEDLLKYNLTFIDRAAEKSTFHPITDDREIASTIASIESKLRDMDTSSQQVAKENLKCDKLKEMHKQLKEAEKTEGRNACVKELKSITQKLDNLLDNFQEWNVTEPVEYQSEIGNAINLLQNLIKTCTIKRQESTKLVGCKKEEQDLVSKLTSGSGSNPSALSIVGMKGVGKTTLAKVVYYNKDIVEHFPVRVWVTVTEGAVNRAKALLMKRDGTKDQTLYLINVCDQLKEKLCLVVLDNVSKTTDLDKLYRLLYGSGWTDGSRIVLTTRFKDVALHANNSSTPHHIRLLMKEESWMLFQKVASRRLEPKEESLAKKLVGKCGGLPLAILSLGCVISANGTTPTSLSWVLDQINHGHFKKYWLQPKDNREELSNTMRDCLYCFTNFPLDYEIPARRLVNLWVGEGLVQQNNGKTPEDTAESYLEELIDSNMIQVVALKGNGKIKTCRLPSMLREIILQNNNRTSQSRYWGTHLERRISYHFYDHGLNENSAQAFSKKGTPLSVLFFDKREGCKPGEHVGKILSTSIADQQFLETRVLDLECIFRPQLPKTLSKLNNLKYLSLRWTYLEELPPCICKLQELETLDLKHTCINYIPRSIWELKKLKKLYLPQNYRSKLEGKPRGHFNEILHILWGVFLYGNYPLLHYLHKLKNLQKLKLAFQLKISEQETLAEKIVKLEQLHSLTLKSVDETGDPKKLKWINMSKLDNLSSLRLFGKLEDKIRTSLLPINLTELTLTASQLSVDPMPQLQNLKKLKSLCFYADSFIEKRMVCTSRGFEQLQVLRFWNLERLEEWDVKEGAMPSLMEFEARSCINFAFPSGLKHVKTIRTIKLRKMNNPFVKNMWLYRKKALLVNVEIN